MTKEERITKLREAYEEFGGQPKDMEKTANTLNQQGITTARGVPWNAINVRQQLNAHFPDLIEARPGKKAKKDTAKTPKKPRTVAQREKPEGASPKTAELIPLPVSRPTFKTKLKKKQGSFKTKEEIYNRAVQKMEKDIVRTGGTMAKLVEILLWMYIGAPEDLLEENPYA